MYMFCFGLYVFTSFIFSPRNFLFQHFDVLPWTKLDSDKKTVEDSLVR
jgi:hypothetical protein